MSRLVLSLALVLAAGCTMVKVRPPGSRTPPPRAPAAPEPPAPAASARPPLRGFLGTGVRPGDGGMFVEEVRPGSPAEAAGVRRGDLILAVGGRATPTEDALRDALSPFGPGNRVEIALRNGDLHRTATAVLAHPPGSAPPPQPAAAPATAAAAPVPARPAPTAPPAARPAPAPAGAPGDTYVLIVGVNAYRDARIRALRFAEADARDVYGFYATSRKSPTAADRVQLLVGEEATRAAVLRALREHLAAKATRPEDTAILYFAGHGFADAQDTYLATEDADLDQLPETAIAGEALKSYWAQIRAGNKVLLTDACRSGGLKGVRGIGGVRVAPDSGTGTGTGTGTSLTIAATGPNELSTEDERLGHGVFTIALVNAFRGEGDADGDGRVSGEELGAYLQREVPALAAQAKGKQTPVVESAGGGAGRIWLSR